MTSLWEPPGFRNILYDFADAALQQIRDKRYTEKLDKLRCGRKYVYGIAFCRKDCAVTGGEEAAVWPVVGGGSQ